MGLTFMRISVSLFISCGFQRHKGRDRTNRSIHGYVYIQRWCCLSFTGRQLRRKLARRHRSLGAEKATQKSSDLSKSPWGTFPHFVPTTGFVYDPLLITIISHNFQETSVVENKISNLLSRIVALEDCFDSPPSSVPDQRRRDDLIRCGATIPPLLPVLIPLSKLDAIRNQLRLFSEKSESLLSADDVQTNEDAFQLLEDIQEAILDYQVRSQPDTLPDVDEDNRRCNRQWPTIKDSGK